MCFADEVHQHRSGEMRHNQIDEGDIERIRFYALRPGGASATIRTSKFKTSSAWQVLVRCVVRSSLTPRGTTSLSLETRIVSQRSLPPGRHFVVNQHAQNGEILCWLFGGAHGLLAAFT